MLVTVVAAAAVPLALRVLVAVAPAVEWNVTNHHHHHHHQHQHHQSQRKRSCIDAKAGQKDHGTFKTGLISIVPSAEAHDRGVLPRLLQVKNNLMYGHRTKSCGGNIS